MGRSFTDSAAFDALAHHAFNKADEDGDGAIDLTELVIALCRVHIVLHKGAPGLTRLPTKEKVRAVLASADLNRDGLLNLDEFHRFAKLWFKNHSRDFVHRALTLAIIYAVFIPQSAELIRDNVPGGRKLPAKLIALALTLGTLHPPARSSRTLTTSALVCAQASNLSPRVAPPRKRAHALCA